MNGKRRQVDQPDENILNNQDRINMFKQAISGMNLNDDDGHLNYN